MTSTGDKLTKLFDTPADNAAYEARQAIDRGISAIVRATHGDKAFDTVESFPGSQFTRRVPVAEAGIRAALMLRDIVERELEDQIRRARGKGASWEYVAEILGFTDTDERGNSPAERAFYFVAPESNDGWRFHPSTTYWKCGSCQATVTDRGPFESCPEDNESGHSEDCTRFAGAMAQWRRRVGD